jgi:hypothetical protein
LFRTAAFAFAFAAFTGMQRNGERREEAQTRSEEFTPRRREDEKTKRRCWLDRTTSLSTLLARWRNCTRPHSHRRCACTTHSAAVAPTPRLQLSSSVLRCECAVHRAAPPTMPTATARKCRNADQPKRLPALYARLARSKRLPTAGPPARGMYPRKRRAVSRPSRPSASSLNLLREQNDDEACRILPFRRRRLRPRADP